MQTAKDKQNAKTQAQAALQNHQGQSKQAKAKENIENMYNDTESEDSSDKMCLFDSPRTKAKAYGQIESSEEDSEVDINPVPEALPSTSTKGQRKPGKDEIGMYEFFITGAPNPPDLEDVEEERLLSIQKNIQDKLKERDAERERNITKRMKQYEQKYDFINKALSGSVAHISEMIHSDHRRTAAKVKLADKMVVLPPLFNGTKPEMAKQQYKRFNQYIKFQTKNGHVTDLIGEAIELFEHTLDKKALVWFQEHSNKLLISQH